MGIRRTVVWAVDVWCSRKDRELELREQQNRHLALIGEHLKESMRMHERIARRHG